MKNLVKLTGFCSYDCFDLTIFFRDFLKTNILMTCHANTDCTRFWGTR